MKRSPRGFSLLEMTISMVILAIVLGGAMYFFMFVSKTTTSASNRQAATAQVNQVMSRLFKNFRERLGEGVLTVAGEGPASFVNYSQIPGGAFPGITVPAGPVSTVACADVNNCPCRALRLWQPDKGGGYRVNQYATLCQPPAEGAVDLTKAPNMIAGLACADGQVPVVQRVEWRNQPEASPIAAGTGGTISLEPPPSVGAGMAFCARPVTNTLGERGLFLEIAMVYFNGSRKLDVVRATQSVSLDDRAATMEFIPAQ